MPSLLYRLLMIIPTLFGVSVVVFVLLRVVPGDPIAMMIPPGAGEEDIERLRALYGFDRSVIEQFVIWLGQAMTGDLGTSISLRQNVVGLIAGRLPATLELVFVATSLAVLIGGALALLGTAMARTVGEAALDGLNSVLLAIPDFLWALIFVLLLGVLIPLFPISGRIDPRLDLDYLTGFLLIEALVRFDGPVLLNLVSHMTLPAMALALPLAAVIARVLKASLAEAMTQDYIQSAKVKGLGQVRILLGEALRNAAIPTVTLTGVQVAFLVGGTVLVERIFSYQGIGNMAIDAVINRDLPLIQGLVLTFAVLFIALNLAVDATYARLNPRLRNG